MAVFNYEMIELLCRQRDEKDEILFVALVGMYVETTPGILSRMKTGLTEGAPYEKLRKGLHEMGSMSASIGAASIMKYCEQLRKKIIDDAPGWQDEVPEVTGLIAESIAVLQEMAEKVKAAGASISIESLRSHSP